MGKTLATILLMTSLLVGSLSPVKADWNEKEGVYDVALIPETSKEIPLESPVFNTLQEAIEFQPQKEYSDKPVRINAYEGDYRTTPTLTLPLNNRQLVGRNNPVPTEKLEVSKELSPSLGGAIISSNQIELESDSILENMVVDGSSNYPLSVWDKSEIAKDILLSGNYFINVHPRGSCISLRADEVDGLYIHNNSFNGGENGFIWAYVIGHENPQIGNISFRNNIFYDSKFGISSKSVNGLDLGTEEDKGENIFIKNDYNIKLSGTPTTIPAQWNYWYGQDTDTELKTTEEDILKTFYIVEEREVKVDEEKTLLQSVGDTLIEVLPCYVTDPFNPFCGVSNWGMYE